MKAVSQGKIEEDISVFCQYGVFISDVKSDENEAIAKIKMKDSFLFNDHFSGTSIIQSFFQLAMVLYQENYPDFDSNERLFFLGGINIKYFSPILSDDTAIFSVVREKYSRDILMFKGICTSEKDGKKLARISGTITSKNRVFIR